MSRITVKEVRDTLAGFGCTLLSTYFMPSKEIEYIARCGHRHHTYFRNLLRGVCLQCPDCSRKRKHTIEEVRKEMEKSGCVLLSTEYKNAKTKLRYIGTCGHIMERPYTDFQKGGGRRCRVCYEASRKPASIKRCHNGITYDGLFDFSFRPMQLAFMRARIRRTVLETGPEIESECANSKTTAKVKQKKDTKRLCKRCGNDISFISKTRRLLCDTCKAELHEEKRLKMEANFKEKVKKVAPTIEVIGPYTTYDSKVKCKCLVCGYGSSGEWNRWPSNVLRGFDCPRCSAKKQARTNDEFIRLLQSINPTITPLDEYVNEKKHIRCKCSVCGGIWKVKPENLLILHRGCPHCDASHGERKIKNWLNTHNIRYKMEYVFSDCRDEKPLPFDFFLENRNLCIEYDGIQHFAPREWFGGQKAFDLLKKHDEIKTNYCKAHDISLLRIRYNEPVEVILEKELGNYVEGK